MTKPMSPTVQNPTSRPLRRRVQWWKMERAMSRIATWSCPTRTRMTEKRQTTRMTSLGKGHTGEYVKMPGLVAAAAGE
ncbi:hypothetical protein B0H19DRAFT_1152307 [Mycena capillaripes]|nr:hypothetical protein B0H19DRAFT_1152307 [Mycena capillaripes]